jgi:hypothetical protein
MWIEGDRDLKAAEILDVAERLFLEQGFERRQSPGWPGRVRGDRQHPLLILPFRPLAERCALR